MARKIAPPLRPFRGISAGDGNDGSKLRAF